MGAASLRAASRVPRSDLLYAGIDACGSHTGCVPADASGAIITVGHGGPGNVIGAPFRY